MTSTPRWIAVLAGLAGALALAASGCGSEPATKPPTGRDAGPGGPDTGGVIIGGQDAGFAGFDGSIAKDTARMLNLLGDPSPTVQFGQTHQLSALLVSVGVGAVANEPVTFTLTGAGTLSTATVTTNAVGVATVLFTAPAAIGTSLVTASAAKVAKDHEATWIVSTVKPVRSLVPLTNPGVNLTSSQPQTLVVRLMEDSHALAGGKVTFSVLSGTRGTVQFNRKSVDTEIVTTGVDGTAKLTLSVGSVASEYTFQIGVTEQYSAATPIFTVKVRQDAPCSTDGECGPSEKCDTVAGKCVARPQCAASTDCNAGFTCQSGQCVPAISCSGNSDCTAGWSCDLSTHQCVQGHSCGSNADCAAFAPKTACDPVKKICVYPSQRTCAVDADCPSGFRCANGTCISRISTSKPCTSSAACPMGEYCNPDTMTCVVGCDADAQCAAPTPICDLLAHTCVAGCSDDSQCTPQVCDPATKRCLDAPPAIYDVSGQWNAVQLFHVKGLTPPDVQSALNTIDTIFGAAQSIVDCHVSKFLPSWLQWLVGSAVDSAVCGVMADYVPDWVKTIVHIGADVSKMIQEFEVHSEMAIAQPGTGKTDKHTVSGVDTWKTMYFFWYTNDCPSPAPGQIPPQCAYVEVDLVAAMISPAPSPFTGRVDASTLNVDTHQINFKFGKAVLVLIDKLVEYKTGYPTLKDALNAVVDCVAVNAWIQGVVANILGDYASYASLIDVTGACNSAKQGLVNQLTATITGLNSDVPMSLQGKAGIVLLPGNTSNVADRLAPGVWYGKFNNSGDATLPFGEWYADRP